MWGDAYWKKCISDHYLRLQNELQNMVSVSMGEEEEDEEGEEDALEDALLQDDDSNSKDMPSE